MQASERSAASALPGDGRALTAHLVSGAVGVWMGVHALRAFFTMVTWNVAEDASAAVMGGVAFGVYAIGLLAWPVTRYLGGARPAWRWGLLLALLAVARQAFPGEMLSPTFSFAAAVVWLWWLPAFLRESARAGMGRLVPAAVLLGLSAQSAGQAALHGMDLPMLRSGWALLAATALAAMFVAALWRAGRAASATGGGGGAPGGAGAEAAGSRAAQRAEAAASWGAIGLFLTLFVALTALTNLGYVQMRTGLAMGPAAALIQAGLLAGALGLAWRPSRPVRLALGVAAVALALAVPALQPGMVAGVALVLLTACLAVLLGAAFAPGTGTSRGWVHGAVILGSLLFMVLMMLYYTRYGWPALWVPAVALLAALALRPAEGQAVRGYGIPAALALMAAVGVGLSFVPYSDASPAAGPAPRQLKVFNYNIHQGLDYFSVPSVEEVAAVIEGADADLVTLQEVGRGWNLSGGVDLAGWLKWRFSGYHFIYGPMNGDLWGNIIMSRYPVLDWGTELFPLPSSGFPRGLVWAEVAADGGDLLVVSTHLSAYEGYDEDRANEARALVRFWGQRPRSILAGDFNAHPDDEAIAALLEGGLVEVTQPHGLWEVLTYASGNPYERLDYIFTSPDVASLAAEVPSTIASDHLPVSAVIMMQ